MDLGAPILDVSVTTSTAGGSASSTPAPAVSIVTGGTVSAPGYTPIIISKTITNDLTMAGAAAAVATITPPPPPQVQHQLEPTYRKIELEQTLTMPSPLEVENSIQTLKLFEKAIGWIT